MIHELQLRIPADHIHNEEYINEQICRELRVRIDDVNHIEILKRSIDARKKPVKYNLKVAVYINEEFNDETDYFHPIDVSNGDEVAIIGAGPAGLFAALRALEIGIKPIIFERGKDVRSRRRDLKAIHQDHAVNPESNYCFGEGGAGTFSDGKLYTRSKKRGNVKRALEWFVHFGADKDILVDAHPHIGTNKLPKIIQEMREEIITRGGEVHFDAKLTDLEIENGKLKGITINNDKKYQFDNLILATGHSARDIFDLMKTKGVAIKAKPFALGVRIEHDQNLIDQIQYHGELSGDNLPPASYSLVTQVDGMGVYSFCMCPGGIVAPCATDTEEVVTNGWSPSKRNNPYSNSGIVVQVSPDDIAPGSNDPFVCLNYQKMVERKCWESAGKSQKVPAQRMIDFIEGKVSQSLPQTSYQPGLVSVDLNEVLPKLIAEKLKRAFKDFGNKMKGYLTNSAVLHAPESRTSSPVQIDRDDESLESTNVKGLYPCGEGAGYAGGIISAAIDGMKCIDKIKEKKDAQ
ncbi:FAD-dependent oxidoreductase [Paracrocinitomix mangrovi]|uniref:NAD(P)/FAD-dependent oxidoreductase n=1 Tax=Paracrocinitomix mangrovi TaxID=2862509 RepID=UPI001C8D0D6F|nr:FAD-dependent oxidoreductase [Paracrocinitomix mangrovi]UKN02833.1 FAD-dependent oxidoreductase [Paracrocinitomix mangrovi]